MSLLQFATDVRELGLAVGASLAPEQMQRVEGRAEVFAARLGAMRILAYRALPSVEIQRRLVRKGHAPAAAGEAVGALVVAGLINDEEFARHYARTRSGRRAWPGTSGGWALVRRRRSARSASRLSRKGWTPRAS